MTRALESVRRRLIDLLLVAVVVAVFVGFVAAVGASPLRAFAGLWRGVAGTWYAVSEVLVRATPIALAGVGVAIGLRGGFVNLGAEGQIYMGAIAVTAVGIHLPGLPPVIGIPIALVAGFAAGALWSALPGFLKARFGISEIINTIMLNVIAINIVGILVRTVYQDPSYPLPMSPLLGPVIQFPLLLLPTRLHFGSILALVAPVALGVFVWKTLPGYELTVVGLNPRAARCAGFSVVKMTILAAAIAGGMAGLAGVGEIGGLHHRLLEGISPGFGYIAVVVALLGRNNPIGVLFASIGVAALQVGATAMQRQVGVPAAISWILMGTVVICVLIRPWLVRLAETQLATQAQPATQDGPTTQDHPTAGSHPTARNGV